LINNNDYKHALLVFFSETNYLPSALFFGDGLFIVTVHVLYEASQLACDD